DLRRACIHANEGIRLYNPDRDAAAAVTYGNHDAGVCARLFLARALALMGRTEAAACASEDAVALARRLQHPFSLALAHVFASAVAQTCRRSEHVRFHADAAATIARDQNFRLLFAWSSAFEAWADAETGVHEEGLGRIKKAISDARTTGSDQFVPHLAGLAADACLTRGNAVDGLAFVADGLRVAARTGERFWEAELIRLRGELQLLQNPILYASEGEQSFREAIELARSQGAMLLALRAAVSLGRALSRSGRSAEASNLISATAQDFDRQTGVDLDEANGLLRVLKGH
ncbi:MAG TPA: hypothetical protein VMF66_13190, partial [Candidatus Acidoferrum sp.]|nr:hypothetical protein [Candidatus Acidoferrum sp.]